MNVLNRVFLMTAALAVFFLILVELFTYSRIIVILNGVFAGCFLALVGAYWRLLTNAVMGVMPYSRARQMTLSIFGTWVVVALFILSSVYMRSTGIEGTSTAIRAFAGYLAVICAVLQIYAPDIGFGAFETRDRKSLTVGIGAGLVAGVIIVIMQDYRVLAG